MALSFPLRFAAALALAFVLAGTAQAQLLFSTPPALRTQIDRPVSPALMRDLEAASRAGLADTQVVTHPDLKAIHGPKPAAPGAHALPTLLYVGADYCPYCAAQRWGLALALLRFGKLDGLRYMLSTAHDVFPNTPTLSFAHVRYDSHLLGFMAYELQDRDEQDLQKPPLQVQALFNHFDVPPYTQTAMGIPFVYVDGAYLLTVPMISPQSLQGMDWQQVAAQLRDPHSTLFAAIMPRVNLLTAALCRLDHGQPAQVCRAPGVTAAAGVVSQLDNAALQR